MCIEVKERTTVKERGCDREMCVTYCGHFLPRASDATFARNKHHSADTIAPAGDVIRLCACVWEKGATKTAGSMTRRPWNVRVKIADTVGVVGRRMSRDANALTYMRRGRSGGLTNASHVLYAFAVRRPDVLALLACSPVSERAREATECAHAPFSRAIERLT